MALTLINTARYLIIFFGFYFQANTFNTCHVCHFVSSLISFQRVLFNKASESKQSEYSNKLLLFYLLFSLSLYSINSCWIIESIWFARPFIQRLKMSRGGCDRMKVLHTILLQSRSKLNFLLTVHVWRMCIYFDCCPLALF